MIELLFTILMFVVFGKLLFFAIKATWGIAKILLTIVLLPFILVALAFAGLLYIAFPLLVIIGIVSLIGIR